MAASSLARAGCHAGDHLTNDVLDIRKYWRLQVGVAGILISYLTYWHKALLCSIVSKLIEVEVTKDGQPSAIYADSTATF